MASSLTRNFHLQNISSDPIWSTHSRFGSRVLENTNMLENVQIRATKLFDGFGNLEYPETLKCLNLPTLVYRRLRGDLIELYKHFHTYHRDIISPSFQPKERTTRKHDFQLHHFKANDGIQGVQSNSFYHRSVKAWNNLRKSVVNAKDVNTFKNRLDEIWKNDQIMFDHVPPITSD